MDEALLRCTVRDLTCFRDGIEKRLSLIESTGNIADHFHCYIMLKILNNSIPMLEDIQKMDSQQRTQAHAIFYVSKLRERIQDYSNKYRPSYEQKASPSMKFFIANHFERLFSALGNIICALGKMEPAATVNHPKPAATTTPPALSTTLNPLICPPFLIWAAPLIWLHGLSQLCMSFFCAAAPRSGAADTAPRSNFHKHEHLEWTDGGRKPNGQRTPRPEGARLTIV